MAPYDDRRYTAQNSASELSQTDLGAVGGDLAWQALVEHHLLADHPRLPSHVS
jgi:hypothetical protein